MESIPDDIDVVIEKLFSSEWDDLAELENKVIKKVREIVKSKEKIQVIEKEVEKPILKIIKSSLSPLECTSLFAHQTDLEFKQQTIWADMVLKAAQLQKRGIRFYINKEEAELLLVVEALLFKYLPKRNEIRTYP